MLPVGDCAAGARRLDCHRCSVFRSKCDGVMLLGSEPMLHFLLLARSTYQRHQMSADAVPARAAPQDGTCSARFRFLLRLLVPVACFVPNYAICRYIIRSLFL